MGQAETALYTAVRLVEKLLGGHVTMDGVALLEQAL
jgi:hypothetical protein